MTEAKTRKLIISTTVGAVLLLFILLAIMVYQMITIKVYNDKIADLEMKRAQLEQMIKEGQDTLEVRSLRAWVEMRARELGYTFENELPI